MSQSGPVARLWPSANRPENHITQRVDYKKQKDAGAYPLTMVIYAMVPTTGVKPAKATAIARFLDYVAGPPEPEPEWRAG